jgi:hypothetical protein
MSEIYKKLYGNVVPDLYPKLEMGSRPLKGDEAEVILKAADLKALPQVFYTGDKGLGLVTKEGQKYVPDPEAGTISISRTYSRRFGAGPPKSKHSKRTIRVPVVVGPILTAAAGSRDSGPLFLTGNGRPFAKSLVQRAFKRLLNNLGLTYRNVHQLRHSVATALISNGTPLGDVAKYLGDSVATVVKTYLHPSGANPAADLDRLFSSLPSVAVAETSTSRTLHGPDL